MISCDPNNLANLARCFSCLPGVILQQARTYLLCGLTNVGGFGLNLIQTGSTYQGTTPTFTLTVVTNTSYQIIWGANDLSMTMGGVTYTSPGVGQMTTVFTKGNTQMVFTGTFAGTTVTAIVRVAPASAIPIPTGFTFVPSGNGANVTASWDAPPSGPSVTKTELWTSTDNITFTLAATINVPTTSNSSVTAPAAGAVKYGKIRMGNASGTLSGFTPAYTCYGRAANWAARVITNGGASLSSGSMIATNTLVSALVAASLDSGKIISMILLVPDNLIASITPLYKAAGSDPWTNHNLVAGDLNTNGLVGDAATKYLDSGFNCNTSWASGNNALFVYASAIGASPGHLFCTTGAASTNDGLYVDGTPGVSTGYNSQTVATSGTQFGPGFYVGSRTTANRMDLYFAKSTTAWSSIGNSVSGAGALSSHNLYLLARDSSDTPASFSNSRVSIAGMASGLSSAEGQALFNAVQAFRTALGGGFA